MNPDKHHTPDGDHANLCYPVRRQNALPLGSIFKAYSVVISRLAQPTHPSRFRLPLSLNITGSRDRRGEPTTTVGQQGIFPGTGDEEMGNKGCCQPCILLDMIPQSSCSSSAADLNPRLHMSTTYKPPATTLRESMTNLHKPGQALHLSAPCPVSTGKSAS